MSPSFYSDRIFVPEYCRIAYTRFKLGSHWLRIETGRWSRIPRERRACACGEVQDEVHVLLHCTLLDNIRRQFGDLNFSSVATVMGHEDMVLLSKYIFVILKKIYDINDS